MGIAPIKVDYDYYYYITETSKLGQKGGVTVFLDTVTTTVLCSRVQRNLEHGSVMSSLELSFRSSDGHSSLCDESSSTTPQVLQAARWSLQENLAQSPRSEPHSARCRSH